jgi:hypothetical protein
MEIEDPLGSASITVSTRTLDRLVDLVARLVESSST